MKKANRQDAKDAKNQRNLVLLAPSASWRFFLVIVALISSAGCRDKEAERSPAAGAPATAQATAAAPSSVASSAAQDIPFGSQGAGCPPGFWSDGTEGDCSRYRAAGQLHAARSEFRAVRVGTELLIVGGRDEQGPLDVVDVYDVNGLQWKLGPKLGTPRFKHAAVVLKDGRVLVMGGTGPTGVLGSTELYDPAQKTWTAGPPLAAPRSDAVAALLPDGRVLIAGGRDQQRECVPSAELFDPGTGRFRTAGRLAAAQKAGAAMVGADGKVYLVGGSCGDAVFGMEVFDPKSGVWSAGKPPSVPRAAAAAAILDDGRILLAGGSGQKTDPLAVAEVWSLEAGWTRVADMRTARMNPTATLMDDGRVLVAGGSIAKLSPTTRVEIYDPRRDRWLESTPLPAALTNHGAALLRPGKALIFGGLSDAQGGRRVADALFYEWVER